MKLGQIVCPENKELQLSRVRCADTALERARGLLGSAPLSDDDGMLLAPCNSVHTFFLRFAIDVVFLDRQNRIIKIVKELQPFRLAGALRAASVLELCAGTAGRLDLQPGDRLLWQKEKQL